MTISEIIEIIKHLFCREFYTNDTMELLTLDRMKFLSWGVSKKYNIDNKGLLFKVRGHHHKGYVLVTLNFLDLYNVYLISNKGEIKDSVLHVFFDQLSDVIDNKIERIPEYVR